MAVIHDEICRCSLLVSSFSKNSFWILTNHISTDRLYDYEVALNLLTHATFNRSHFIGDAAMQRTRASGKSIADARICFFISFVCAVCPMFRGLNNNYNYFVTILQGNR